MDADEYVAKRLDDQIEWYDRKSGSAKWWFHALKVIEIIAATLVALSAGFVESGMPYIAVTTSVLAVVIAVSAGLTSLFQFQEHWIKYRTTAESLKKEKFLFETRVEPYNGEDVLTVLVQRVETLVSQENTNWAQYMMRPEKEVAKHGK